ITGASGNTGSAAAHALLDSGKQVRVIGRNPDHLRQFTARGAEAFIADVTDEAKLSTAFKSAEAVYLMIPPNLSAEDYYAYDERVTSAYVSALRQARVSHAVVLSSIGADKPAGTGPVVGLHRLEKALDQIGGLNTLHIRAGYFMENTLAQAGVIRSMGNMVGPVRGDLKLPMIAGRDIGAAAARAMVSLDFKGHETRELQGQRDITYNEAAVIIGKTIGKPDLKYAQLPNDQLRPALVNMGMSNNFVDLLLEMAGALNSGYMKNLEPRSARNTTTTSFETFVAEKFLPVFQRLTAAA
ncbi:MAG TPA: NAD(P)H-binding protein, partial [Terriglobales bacterium]|nr:NAD(P)H-binding protein [Terriglobales bacterium]